MKSKKIKFEKIDKFKELIELTGLVSYTVESDEGREMLIDLVCSCEGHTKNELYDFIYTFHAEEFQFWPGTAYLKVQNNCIEISWKESRNLIYEDISNDFYLMCLQLFSLPADTSIEHLLDFKFEASGTIKKTIDLEKLVFILQFEKKEIIEYGFSKNELKRIKNGILFSHRIELSLRFQNALKKILKKYRVSNSTFSLTGDECFLNSFDTLENKERKIVLI